jgi:site-specific DNA-adenine methylase
VSDLNPKTINFWQLLRDRPEDLISEIESITPHREMMNELRTEGKGIQTAAQLYWQGQMAFSGVGTRWSTGTSDQRLEVVSKAHQKGFQHLWAASNRLQNVQIIQQDCFETIDQHLHDKSALIYFDPPYPHQSRGSKDNRYKDPAKSKPRRQYAVEMEDELHAKISKTLEQAQCQWVLSGYPNKIYHLGEPLQKSMRTSDNLIAQECLWMPESLKKYPPIQHSLFA